MSASNVIPFWCCVSLNFTLWPSDKGCEAMLDILWFSYSDFLNILFYMFGTYSNIFFPNEEFLFNVDYVQDYNFSTYKLRYCVFLDVQNVRERLPNKIGANLWRVTVKPGYITKNAAHCFHRQRHLHIDGSLVETEKEWARPAAWETKTVWEVRPQIVVQGVLL